MAVLSSKSDTVGSERITRTGAVGVSRVHSRSTAATLGAMPRLTLPVAAVVLALAIGGCSSSHTAAAPAPTPSKAPFHATQIQWASAMNGPISDWQKYYGQYSDGGCPQATSFTCTALPNLLSLDAQAIGQKILDCQDATKVDYIGPPPAAMAQLVQTTETDAIAVGADTDTSATLSQDAFNMHADLEAWGPYLNG